MTVDAYEILGVDETVDERELRSAYRARARLVHPDVNPDSAGQLHFAKLSAAYRLLADPTKRSEIDAQRAQRTRFQAGRPAPEQRIRRGGDVVVTLDWDDHAPLIGEVHEVTVSALNTCATCAGAGSARPQATTDCAGCTGTGYIQHVQHTMENDIFTWRPCRECAATGIVPLEPCADCAGTGRRRAERSVSVSITADTLPGSTLVVRGAGHVGRWGGPAGDLLLVVAD